jgi:hypothetical protein
MPAAPPANDSFADPVVLGGTSIARTADSTVAATTETGEPASLDGALGGSSVWYRWTAPASGVAVVDTDGSGFDTLLGVYSGDAVDALSEIVSDDDAGSDLTSGVVFHAHAGTTYRILVDGYDSAAGAVKLNLTLITAPAAPASVSAAAGNGQATVNWSAPASDGGSPVDGYQITPYVGGVAQAPSFTSAAHTSLAVGGLTNGTTYTFTVAASNDIGLGSESAPSNAVTPTAPGTGGGSGGGGGGGGGLAADLAVDGSVAPPTAGQGDTLTWTFHVVDATRGPAVDVNLDLALSSNLTFGSSTTTRGPGCSAGGAKVHCFLDWMSGDAASATITVTATAASAGDYSISAVVSQLIPDANTANNTIVLKATTPLPPPPPVKPVIGRPTTTPAAPRAGKRVVIAFPVTRSDTGKSLTAATVTFSARIQGVAIRSAHSFGNGRARLVLTLPKASKGRLLTVKLMASSGEGSASRTFTTRIR